MVPRPRVPRDHDAALDGETLLLVDHHQVFAEVLARSLRGRGSVARVELAHDLETARAKTLALRPGVVLLDSRLGRENGLDLIPMLLSPDQDAWAIVLSESRWPLDVAAAFARGAHGWVSKTGPLDDLLSAVDAAHRGERFLAPAVVGPVMALLNERLGHRTRAPSFVDTITSREREVLDCLVEGLSRTEVASRLFISPNTVRTHVQNLLRAADVHSTIALVAAARGAVTGPEA